MKYTLLTFLLVCITLTCFSQSFEEKFQRAKIYYSDSQQLSQLESLGVAVDHGKHKKGYFIISNLKPLSRAIVSSVVEKSEIIKYPFLCFP